MLMTAKDELVFATIVKWKNSKAIILSNCKIEAFFIFLIAKAKPAKFFFSIYFPLSFWGRAKAF